MADAPAVLLSRPVLVADPAGTRAARARARPSAVRARTADRAERSHAGTRRDRLVAHAPPRTDLNPDRAAGSATRGRQSRSPSTAVGIGEVFVQSEPPTRDEPGDEPGAEEEGSG